MWNRLNRRAYPICLGVIVASLLSFPPALAADIAKLKPTQEIDIVQSDNKIDAEIRVTNDSFFAKVPRYGVIVFAHAPEWKVCEIAPDRKLFCETPLKDWNRRGVPLTMMYLGDLPEWPTVPDGQTSYKGLHVSRYALPCLNRRRQPLPLSKGTVGQMIVFSGVSANPATSIQRALFHTPVANGLLLTLSYVSGHSSSKYNSLFLYSGYGGQRSRDVRIKSLTITRRHPLPSLTGLTRRADSRDVWVSEAGNEDINDFLK